MSRIVRGVALVWASLLACACATPATFPVDSALRPAGWVARVHSESARSPSGIFELRVPQGWRVADSPALASLILVHGRGLEDGIITIQDYPLREALEPAAFASLRESVLEGMKAEQTSLRVESQLERRIGGRNAALIRYQSRVRGEPVTGLFTLVMDPRGVVSIHVMVPETQAPELETVIWSLASSLRLTPPS